MATPREPPREAGPSTRHDEIELPYSCPRAGTKQRERAVNAGMPAIHQRIVLRNCLAAQMSGRRERSVPHGRRLLKACFAPDAPETPGATGQPDHIVTGRGFLRQRHGAREELPQAPST